MPSLVLHFLFPIAAWLSLTTASHAADPCMTALRRQMLVDYTRRTQEGMERAAIRAAELYGREIVNSGSKLFPAQSPALRAYLDAVFLENAETARALNYGQNGDRDSLLRVFARLFPERTEDVRIWQNADFVMVTQRTLSEITRRWVRRLDELQSHLSPADLELKSRIMDHIDCLRFEEIDWVAEGDLRDTKK